MTKEKTKISKEKPAWIKIDEKDLKSIIIKLAKQGLTSEKIGLELRDSYGIPTTKVMGIKISEILKKEGIYQDADKINLGKKQERIMKHFEKNKQDKKAKRALTIINARITKNKRYEKRKNAEEDKRGSKRISKSKRK